MFHVAGYSENKEIHKTEVHTPIVGTTDTAACS